MQTFKTLSESGHKDVVVGFFQDGTLSVELEGEYIELSPRMVRQLADFISRELDKDTTP